MPGDHPKAPSTAGLPFKPISLRRSGPPGAAPVADQPFGEPSSLFRQVTLRHFDARRGTVKDAPFPHASGLFKPVVLRRFQSGPRRGGR